METKALSHRLIDAAEHVGSRCVLGVESGHAVAPEQL
jgi:hypothetical protein